MFRHQGAIHKGFTKKKDHKYSMYLGASRACPLYIFDSDMEAHVNMRRGVTHGLHGEVVVTILRVLKLAEMFLRAGEFIRNQEVFKVRLGRPGS
jgi:hypothetical protein